MGNIIRRDFSPRDARWYCCYLIRIFSLRLAQHCPAVVPGGYKQEQSRSWGRIRDCSRQPRNIPQLLPETQRDDIGSLEPCKAWHQFLQQKGNKWDKNGACFIKWLTKYTTFSKYLQTFVSIGIISFKILGRIASNAPWAWSFLCWKLETSGSIYFIGTALVRCSFSPGVLSSFFFSSIFLPGKKY